MVGLAGAQGAGKSTAAAAVAGALAARGRRVAALSLDDLYLGRAARRALAARAHPLFATRGPPGTHDVALGLDVLGALAAGRAVRLPRFDKAADEPRPAAAWPAAPAPADVVLFEGWCVGARPEPDAALARPVNALEAEEDPDGRWRRAVNDALAGPYQALWARVDVLAFLAAPGWAVVPGWRLEQEAALAAAVARRGGGGAGVMDAAGVARFVQHFERVTRHMLAELPARADVVVRLDARRGVAG